MQTDDGDLEAAGIVRFDDRGRIADFHSLRHTFCTNLQRLGTLQRVLMDLMWHSDQRLSDHTYTDTRLLPLKRCKSSSCPARERHK